MRFSLTLPRLELRRFGIRAASVLVALAVIGAASADAQSVRFTVSPRVTQMQWDDGLAFDRVLLAGISTIADFGPWVSLEAHAAAGRDLRARFGDAGLMDTLGAPASDADLDLSRFGLAMRIYGGRSRVAPFARAGGEVMRFESPDGRETRTVALSYGGGIRASLGSRWRADLLVEEVRLRLDRSQLAPGVAAGTDADAALSRRNLALSASLGYSFGGAAADSAERTRFRLVSVPVEAFGGRLRLADAAIPEATVAGLRLGVDVGQNVGVRAYHLRRVGTHPEVEGMVSSTGAEMKFNLNAVPRLAPYFIVGGGQVDFSDDFRDRNGQPRTDHGVLILGGGIGWRVGDKFRIDASIRDLIHAGDDPLNAVSSTSDLRHAVLVTAGVAFNIGRTRRGGIAVVRDTTPATSPRRARETPAGTPRGVEDDSIVTGRDAARDAARDSMPPAVRDHQSERFITIPLPKEGEFYVRYGPVDTARLRSVRAADGQVDTLLIQALVRREVERMVAALGAAAATPGAPIIVQPPTVIVPRETPAAPLAARPTTPTPLVADTAAARRLAAERDEARAELAALRARLAALEAALAAPPVAPPADTAAAQRRDAEAKAEAEAEAKAEAEAEAEAEAAATAEAKSEATAEARAVEWRRQREALGRLRASPPDVIEVVEHPRGLVVKLGGGVFGSNEATFDAAGRMAMGLVAALAVAYPDASIAVEGHTDALGDERYNQLLSERRAEFVRNALVRAGIAPGRVTVAGFGPHHPIADNETAAGRAKNRRVEVVLLGAVAPPPATP